MDFTPRSPAACSRPARNLVVVALVWLAIAGAPRATPTRPNTRPVWNLGAGAGDARAQQEFLVKVGDRVFFETDSTSIRPRHRRRCDKQAQWLNQYRNYRIMIEGHADERGTREYNVALGARRAAATRDYLVSRGVAAGQIKTISYGKEQPVAVCDDISCWSQNRRAVTVLGGAGM